MRTVGRSFRACHHNHRNRAGRKRPAYGFQRQPPPPHVARIRTTFPRGCQARRHDVEDNIIPGCQAPPPHAARIRTTYPRGATFNIVGLGHAADVEVRASNNIENGTSTACGSTRSEHWGAQYPRDVAMEFKTQNSKLRTAQPISNHSNHRGCSALYQVSTCRISSFLSCARTDSSTRSKSIIMWSFGR
jgi:hypothetical protein